MSTSKGTGGTWRCRLIAVVTILAVSLWTAATSGQGPGDEHAQHHGGGAAGVPGGPPGGEGMGGMGGMGKMMEKMGVPPPKELYPSLMALPDLPPEKRAEVQRQAHERMKSGAALMDEALATLSRAAPTDDYAAMQAAAARLREGLAQFDSGLAAHRALAEGKAPRNVALQWFKHEMNLSPPAEVGSGPVFGGSTFHLVVIAILFAFFVAMIWMYFLKMRRASALIERLIASPSGQDASACRPDAASKPSTAPAVSSPSAGDPPPAALPTAVEASPPPAPEAARGKNKWSGSLRVARIFAETPEVKTFRLVPPEWGALPFDYHPGQFLVLTVSTQGQKVKRSYTIASSPTQRNSCEISVKREEHGVVSGFLHDAVQVGESIEVSAPNGKFTFSGTESDSIVLIGGGVGITPLMSVVRYLCDAGWEKDIFLLYCCRTSRDFIFREELEYLQRRHANLHVVATMTRAEGTVWMGLKGRFNKEILSQSVPDLAARRIHVCGPPPMMEGILGMLGDLGIPADNIHTEAFGPAQRPAAKRALAAGCECEKCERRRAEATKAPAPEAAPAPTPATVTFQASGKSAPLPPSETVLDVADEIGVQIDNSCRVGSCGTCKVKLLSGSVTMECEDALEPDEKASGTILACQAKSTGDVAVDA